jgi:hypothetical protein
MLQCFVKKAKHVIYNLHAMEGEISGSHNFFGLISIVQTKGHRS